MAVYYSSFISFVLFPVFCDGCQPNTINIMACTLPRYLTLLRLLVLFFIIIFQSAVLGVTNCCCLAVQIVVGGRENSVVLQNLNSLTEYEIAVFAVYRSAASDALRGNQITRESSSKLATTSIDYRTSQNMCYRLVPFTISLSNSITHNPHAYSFPKYPLLCNSISTFLYTVYFLTTTL